MQSRATAIAAVVTLSLTLGVGAAILALVDAVLLTPPPFADPGSLVVLSESPSGEASASTRRATYGTFEEWREAAGSMARLEAIDGANLTLTGLGDAERVNANDVTPGVLRLLGVTPSLGRTFEAGDAGQPVVIVSDRIWREKLGADPNAIGRAISLGGVNHAVIGVLPRPTQFDPTAADFWRPIAYAITPAFRSSYRVSVYARLAHGTSTASLSGALEHVSRRSSPPSRVVVSSMSEQMAGDSRKTLAVLGAAAALAVLLAFVNIGGLIVVRSIDRQRELAIRSALGASPADIVKKMLLETQLLVAIGIAGGVLIAVWITPPFARLALQQFAGSGVAPPVDWRAIAIIAVGASIAGALCTLPPALASSRRDVIDTLRRGATAPPREVNLRRMFVIVQVALAFVMLASVTLLGAAFVRVLNIAPGFDAGGVLALKLSLPAAAYPDDKVVPFYAALQDAVKARLGGDLVSLINEVPLDGSVSRRVLRVRQLDDAGPEAVVREAAPDYFQVMHIRLIAGRSFDARDGASARRRIVISESLARALRMENPIGQQIWYSTTQPAEVVGIVADVKHQRLDETVEPTAYVPAAQSPSRGMVLVARSMRPDAYVVAAVREEVARLDPAIPVYGVAGLTDIVSRSRGMRERRVITATFAGFGVLAIVLAAVGLFAVTAHDVLSRQKEFALRIAIGARPARVTSHIIRQAGVMVVAGSIAGAVVSVLVNSGLVSAGFATARVSALALGLPTAVVVIGAVLALLPAMRAAMCADPSSILRS